MGPFSNRIELCADRSFFSSVRQFKYFVLFCLLPPTVVEPSVHLQLYVDVPTMALIVFQAMPPVQLELNVVYAIVSYV